MRDRRTWLHGIRRVQQYEIVRVGARQLIRILGDSDEGLKEEMSQRLLVYSRAAAGQEPACAEGEKRAD